MKINQLGVGSEDTEMVIELERGVPDLVGLVAASKCLVRWDNLAPTRAIAPQITAIAQCPVKALSIEFADMQPVKAIDRKGKDRTARSVEYTFMQFL